MPRQWTETTARYLLDTTKCPRCSAPLVDRSGCSNCNADLSGETGLEIFAASQAAADQLRRRERLVGSLPARVGVPASLAPHLVVTPPITQPATTAAPLRVTTASPLSVQSVLAVAGAGLFAVAAIVFTFFNPDLTNFATRSTIIAVITLVFLGGALLLARRGLQFSAEAIGALGAVFLALDVWAFSTTESGASAGWIPVAVGTVIASVLLLLLASRVRLRTWLWPGLVGLSVSPALFAFALDGAWTRALGWIAVAFAARGAHALATRMSPRFSSPLLADRGTATVLQLGALLLSAGALFGAVLSTGGSDWVVPASGVLLLAALACAVSASTLIRSFWSFGTGALMVLAIAILPFTIADTFGSWLLALVSLAAAAGVVIVALLRPWLRLKTHIVKRGAWTVALLFGLPALFAPVTQVSGALTALIYQEENRWSFSDFAMAAVIALFATTASALVLAFATRSNGHVAYRAFAAWIFVAGIIGLASWSGWLGWMQALLSLALAGALVIALLRVPLLSAQRPAVKVPLILGAHALVALAGVISWADPDIRVVFGVLTAAAVLAVSLLSPVGARPAYLGVAYAFALAVFAAALTLAGLEVIAVLCLTTSLASLAALGATITHWLSSRSWYAVLGVTAVPFAIGVISVISVRSGWTGLSTAVTFALLLTLVVTRREGMTRLLRTAAASLLVPALAVVVVCVGAEVLAVSASPITLPIIAAIVAIVLPASSLLRLPDARYVRIAIEIGALTTAAIAVLLSLVRVASGFATTFLVLLILGIGAIATAVFARRRYGWPLAGASLTGALWCVWALAGITAIEPYLLPPALAAAAVGALLVARGLPGMGLSALGLFWTGLATATFVSLAVLTGIGSGNAVVPWRAIGILAAAVLFILVAALIPRLVLRHPLRLIGVLRTPLLVMAVVAASAGVIQAVRFARGVDGAEGIVPTLIASAVAVVIATVAARVLASDADSRDKTAARVARSRALYVPAVIYLVVGPIVAIRPGWLPILVVLGISVAVLALMIITAVRARTRNTTLPPVSFLFVVAWCTAVASWSERELRVEAYSLPLGVALLVVGIIGMIPGGAPVTKATLRTWPHGFTGSWRLLAPGILVILVPSVLSTGTDPLTQRAILVIALALIAILIGNMRRLAAPFILGIIVLPIENVVVFAVQLGQSISALPWWITLATAGAVLLVLAVSSERRVGADKGAAARIRDLT